MERTIGCISLVFRLVSTRWRQTVRSETSVQSVLNNNIPVSELDWQTVYRENENRISEIHERMWKYPKLLISHKICNFRVPKSHKYHRKNRFVFTKNSGNHFFCFTEVVSTLTVGTYQHSDIVDHRPTNVLKIKYRTFQNVPEPLGEV